MSKRASDLIVDYSEKTGNKTVLPVYFALCYHANPSRTCFPGYSRLKQVSGIGSSSSISNALKILEKLGIITIKKVAGKVSFYQLNEEPTCPTVGHEEWSLKNDQRRTFMKKGMGAGEIKKWVETIAPITEELKGSPIVPLERRILEHLLHRFSGEDVLAIRESERGRKGLEFGILHPEAKDTDLWTQAEWACGTVKKNIERFQAQSQEKDFIAFLGRRYAPVGAENDKEGLNQNWVRNVKFWYERFNQSEG